MQRDFGLSSSMISYDDENFLKCISIIIDVKEDVYGTIFAVFSVSKANFFLCITYIRHCMFVRLYFQLSHTVQHIGPK